MAYEILDRLPTMKNYQTISRMIAYFDVVYAIYQCIILTIPFFVGPLVGFAAWKLLKATQQGVSPVKGLHGCRIWRAIIIFCIVLKIILLVTTFGISFIIETVAAFIHIWSLFIVQHYMSQKTAELAFQQALDI